LFLKRQGSDAQTAEQLISAAVQGCGREVPGHEIQPSVQNAWNTKARIYGPRWPKPNNSRIQSIALNGPNLTELARRSPEQIDISRTDWLIDQLFPGEATLLCVGEGLSNAVTRRKVAFRGGFINYQFIVPNRMTGAIGTTQTGRKTQRCLNNTSEREFLVVESDPPRWEDLPPEEQRRFAAKEQYIGAKKDEAAAVLWKLAGLSPAVPLVLVVDSGGKSLHGWFYVGGVTERTAKLFFAQAINLGADPATWTRCQFVRMPNGLRDNGNRQSVLYFSCLIKEVK
jgi:hypothetical protein